MHRILSITLLFLFAAAGVQAQRLPERSLVRKGNRQYNKGEYEASIGRYEEALKAAPGQFEATYNLGNALYKAERFDRAEQTMVQAAADSLRSDAERAEAFYNLGNAQFKQQKYKEALESYKQSLRLNPADMEAKYNYAYTKPEPGSEPAEPTAAKPGSEPESGPKTGSAEPGPAESGPAESGPEPAGSKRKTRPTGTGRGSTDPFGHLPARAGADARRHPGPGGQDPGETQGEGQGRRGPRQERKTGKKS